ncbi:phosphotransferase enzyme family protein [Streptomyces sp. CBMA156]|uniref:phosphotransferase enzyme family protein n=1 Tax=Streptomyces sp. CBMA156 TaxID=1930280 RepID=UPI0016620467|nr:phosphotransferase [Streptomyces sp. CBMA156]MBD0671520.1 kinase [Streptomyces sp. CBMA156]
MSGGAGPAGAGREDELPLSGGNMNTGVVRVGDTVRRPAGPWTPAVHALLEHLHAAGFRAAPRPLGLDEQGREVLTYQPGRVVWPDRFDLLDPAERLAGVARLIRGFHDAVRDFTPPPDARWQVLMPPDGPADIIAHNDLAPWNLVGGDGHRWSFIDWDTAAPGTRLWDLAYALHGFLPLSARPGLRRTDAVAAARLRVFVDAYGLDEGERRALVPLLGPRTLAMHDFLRDRAGRGVQPWARLWAEGHGEVWRTDAEYVEGRREAWERALLDG